MMQQRRLLLTDGNTVRSFLSRSCAEEYAAADECYISNSNYIPDSQIEYTCVSTCDTDGCNTGIRKIQTRIEIEMYL